MIKWLAKVIVGEIGYSLAKTHPIIGGAILGVVAGQVFKKINSSDSVGAVLAPEARLKTSSKLSKG